MNLQYLGDLVFLSVGIIKKKEQEERPITGMKRQIVQYTVFFSWYFSSF